MSGGKFTISILLLLHWLFGIDLLLLLLQLLSPGFARIGRVEYSMRNSIVSFLLLQHWLSSVGQLLLLLLQGLSPGFARIGRVEYRMWTRTMTLRQELWSFRVEHGCHGSCLLLRLLLRGAGRSSRHSVSKAACVSPCAATTREVAALNTCAGLSTGGLGECFLESQTD